MPTKSSIPLQLQAEVRRKAAEGLSGPKIAAWLAEERGCMTTPRAVQRLLQAKAHRQRNVGVSEPEGLTGRQVRFIEEYLLTLNATVAARKAGYSARTAASQGSELLKNPKVKAAVDRAIENRAIRVAVRADDVLGELLRIARADLTQAFTPEGQLKPIHEIPEDVRRAIAGVEVEQLFEGRGQKREKVGDLVKVKFWNKVSGLDLLGRHLNLWEKSAGDGEHDAAAAVRARLLAKLDALRDAPDGSGNGESQ